MGLTSFKTFIRAFSGAAAGSFSISLLFPLETVRTRIQVDNSSETRSTLRCFKEIVSNEGVPALFRGWWSMVVALSVTNFVYFYVFHSLRMFVISVSDADQAVGNDLLFGIIAGGAAVLVSNPLWVVNTRLKLQSVQVDSGASSSNRINRRHSGIIDCLVKMVRHEGVSALLCGSLSSLALSLNPAVNYMIYEALKRNFSHFVGILVTDSVMFFSFGAASKFIATVLTYPLQLIQTRARAGVVIPTMQSFWYRIRFMYRGIESKLLQTVLNSAIMLLTYEHIEKTVLFLFTRYNRDSREL